jgi:hypothetical protein
MYLFGIPELGLDSDEPFLSDEDSYESSDEERQNSVTPITPSDVIPLPSKRLRTYEERTTIEAYEERTTIAPIALQKQNFRSKTEAMEEAMLAFNITFRAKSATFPSKKQYQHAQQLVSDMIDRYMDHYMDHCMPDIPSDALLVHDVQCISMIMQSFALIKLERTPPSIVALVRTAIKHMPQI